MGVVIPYNEIESITDKLQSQGIDIILCSCPADPLHLGHIRYFEAAHKCMEPAKCVPPLYKLFVIVNGDSFLQRKKGFIFMHSAERAEIISKLNCVDYVSVYDAEVQDVSDCIRKIRPKYFCNGGDRKDDSTAPQCEIDACNEVGAKRVYGVGGYTKLNSSSNLIYNILRQKPIGELHQFSDKIHKIDHCLSDSGLTENNK